MLLMGPGSVSPLPADAAPTHEMAHWLAAQGHQVRVQWRAGLAAALRHMAWRPHLVWVASLSAAGPLAAWAIARLCGAKAWLHLPHTEASAALPPRWLTRRFDVVSTPSGRMLERLHAQGVAPHRCELVPRWTDISAISRRTRADGPSPYRAELGLPVQAVVALYSGPMGVQQGLPVMAQAARVCSGIEFVFCGNGPGRAELEAAAAGLPNVRFLDAPPPERLNDLLALADVHLLPQRVNAVGMVVPSELARMLASGRPVVCAAHADTELARVVAGHPHVKLGMVTAPDSPQALAVAIQFLASDPPLRRRMGRAARAFAEQHVCINAVLARWVRRAQAERGQAPAWQPTTPQDDPPSTLFQTSTFMVSPAPQEPDKTDG